MTLFWAVYDGRTDEEREKMERALDGVVQNLGLDGFAFVELEDKQHVNLHDSNGGGFDAVGPGVLAVAYMIPEEIDDVETD